MGAKTKSRPQAFAAFTLLLLLCIWSTSAFALISLSDGSYGLVLSGSARSSAGTKPFVGSGGLVISSQAIFGGVFDYNDLNGNPQETQVTGGSYTIVGETGSGTMTLNLDPSGPGILGFHTLILNVSIAGYNGNYAGEINFSSHARKSNADNAANVVSISGYMHRQ